ncbi:Uma2 family endonuclease [Acaryochloris sp. IP29b_bin.137]|uniref:Uma2 family endonuclease n=1 Tax=Acaryochloris sp. IP29b_bin.137 TaxID=2969217 RepID=UPI002630D984|nr:Uma2 family endonuclease [Acaryochloris sp. IP29b_bin.137]
MTTCIINLKPAFALTTEQFWQLCVANPELRLEHSTAGELIICPLFGGITSNRNAHLICELYNWADSDATGIAFGSSTGFTLPNGATRAPSAAWLRQERWDALTPEQRERFVPFCPDFVVELLSKSDELQTTQAKMQEYIDNGARLGWLINRESKQIQIYQPNQTDEILDAPQSISADPVLKGFRLNLGSIW